MRIVVILLLALSLNAAGFWTLTGLTKSNIYVKNELAYLKSTTVTEIKAKLTQLLKENKIAMGEQDSSTLMVSLEELSDDETFYIYVTLALGEEVQTFRADKSATFALTYNSSDFIEVDAEEIDSSVLESVDFLLSQFAEHYQDDNE